jgi:hypothetical protein
MLRSIIRSLFGRARPPRQPFHDAVFGDLKPGETGWTVRVLKGMDTFEFTIGGVGRPDERLLAHAHDIFNDYDSFKKAVIECIEYESREFPSDVKSELAGLEVDNVSLFWPDRPDDGMIFFRGSENDFGLWRCDLINRKPTGLGCDT